MDDLVGGVRQQLAHLVALHPDHPPQLASGVVADPFADRLAAAGDVDRVAGLEAALDGGDADREQTRSTLTQDPGGAGVDDQSPARRLRVLEPELEARRPALTGREAGAASLTGGGGEQRPLL